MEACKLKASLNHIHSQIKLEIILSLAKNKMDGRSTNKVGIRS